MNDRAADSAMSTFDVALAYGRRGYRVFPCGRDKRPLVRWTKAAATDARTIRKWWQRWPEAMIGLCTGDGLSVVDLDVDKTTGERIGEATAERLGLLAELDSGLCAITPSSGRHVYFSGDLPTTAGQIGRGIDTRGAGGYVIAPGSTNGSGLYRWDGPGLLEAEPPLLPDAIVRAHRARRSRGESQIEESKGWPERAGPDEVQEILSHIDPDAGGYQQWCDVLMGLHDHFGGSEAGLQIAERWSQGGAKYQPGEVRGKWQSFSSGGGITFGTVCALAQRSGVDLAEIARRHCGRHEGLADRGRPQSASAVPEHSEEALALGFAARHMDDLRFVAPWGRWLCWRGNKWGFDESLGAFDLTRRVCREAATACGQANVATLLASAKTVAAVERLAKADRRMAASVEQWDADPWLLNTPHGVIDLRTGSARPHRPTDYQTRITAISAGGERATWRQFLMDVTGGDAELQAFLQRLAGYALTGSTREHSLAFLHGTGANGKSVFTNTLAGILGDYHKTAPIETFTASGSDRHPTELAMLRGARLVTAVETEEGRRWAESRIKALTGGDRIAARFMRQDFFEFTPQFKLLIAGNHKPGLRSVDEAIRRRFHLVPFTVTIPPEKRDPDLSDKLRAEWPGILAWAIEGCLAWQRTGLAPPESVLAATAHYLEGQDAIAAWLDEVCELDPGSWTLRSELFASWKVWAERTGEFILPRVRFLDALETRGFVPQRRNTGWGFYGLRLMQHDYTEAHWNR